jgi:hypothetical protein
MALKEKINHIQPLEKSNKIGKNTIDVLMQFNSEE